MGATFSVSPPTNVDREPPGAAHQVALVYEYELEPVGCGVNGRVQGAPEALTSTEFGRLQAVIENALILVFPAAMAYGAATDLLTMRISNRISLALLIAFLVIAPIAGMSGQEMLIHLGVGALLLVAGMLLFSMNLLGGGDAKLLAAAGLWIGFDQLVPFVAYVTIFGGALALLLLAFRCVPAGALPLPRWAARLHTHGEGMPYGVAIAAGALLIYPLTTWPALLAG